MRLSHFLRAGLVVHGLDASDRNEALRKISAFLEEGGFVPSGGGVFEALRAREEVHTTALGEGVAVPHAVIPTLQEILLVVATAREPLLFGPPETSPVDLLFTLLSPPGREAEHIKLLARICRLVRHPGFLEELRAAPGPGELYEAILAVDSQHV
jgi:mannitol/fructose-specific phosphotransferase system IIA component (Ntr-type)